MHLQQSDGARFYGVGYSSLGHPVRFNQGPNFTTHAIASQSEFQHPKSRNTRLRRQNQHRLEYSLATDHLVLVELASQNLQRWLDDPSPQSQYQVQSRLWNTTPTSKNKIVTSQHKKMQRGGLWVMLSKAVHCPLDRSHKIHQI